MTTFAVHYTYADRPADLDAGRPEHRAFLRGLLEDGVLLASGPLSGPSTEQTAGAEAQSRTAGAGALLLVRADDADAVLRLLDADPFARAGLVAHRSVRSWDPVMGPWA